MSDKDRDKAREAAWTKYQDSHDCEYGHSTPFCAGFAAGVEWLWEQMFAARYQREQRLEGAREFVQRWYDRMIRFGVATHSEVLADMEREAKA